PLTLEEVRMLVELFYLPYHHGPQAQHLLEQFRWLEVWGPCVQLGVPGSFLDTSQAAGLTTSPPCRRPPALRPWPQGHLGKLLRLVVEADLLLAQQAFVHLTCVCLLLPPGCQSITAPILLGGDAEPWARRGGLFGELQALLPVGNSCDLFYHPPPFFPSSQVYLLRPLLPLDKRSLQHIPISSVTGWLRVQLSPAPALAGRLLGSFLSLSPEYTFVLEDEDGPCGYA
ncbi:Bifunctional protein NCOAT, partial [Chaetura pelagica]